MVCGFCDALNGCLCTYLAGGDREKQMVNERFDKYMEQDWVRHWCNFKYSIVENFFRSRIPETLQ